MPLSSHRSLTGQLSHGCQGKSLLICGQRPVWTPPPPLRPDHFLVRSLEVRCSGKGLYWHSGKLKGSETNCLSLAYAVQGLSALREGYHKVHSKPWYPGRPQKWLGCLRLEGTKCRDLSGVAIAISWQNERMPSNSLTHTFCIGKSSRLFLLPPPQNLRNSKICLQWKNASNCHYVCDFCKTIIIIVPHKGVGKKVTKNEKKVTRKWPKTRKGYQKVTEKECEWPTPSCLPPFAARWH